MTRLRTIWYWLSMTAHELRCTNTSLYNVHKGDDRTTVIHDACGRVWTAGA